MQDLVQAALAAMDDKAKTRLVQAAIRDEVRAAVAPMVQANVEGVVLRALDAEAKRVVKDGWSGPGAGLWNHQYLETVVRAAAAKKAQEIVSALVIGVDVTIKEGK